MRRTDDVFFFILIDFLVQVFFFGLLLYVVGQNIAEQEILEKRKDAEQVEKLKSVTGISQLTEITDLLTKLAPIDQLRGLADFSKSIGGIEKWKELGQLTNDVGGPEKLKEDLARLRKLEEGSGKPPCLYDSSSGRKVARPLATVVAGEFTIRFTSRSRDLEEVLALLGTTYEEVSKDLPFVEFKRKFGPLTSKRAECRFTLRFVEMTRYVDARDAARGIFYLQPERLGHARSGSRP